MLKKSLAVSILVVLISGGAFAQFSAGFGGTFSSAFDGGIEMSFMGINAGVELPYMGGGFYGFFDAKYAEASFGLFFGTIDVIPTGNAASMVETIDAKIDITVFTLGLLGKFPFNLGALTLFPAVGVEYNAVHAAKYELPEMKVLFHPSDFSNLWLKFGGGLDFSLSEHLFLRGTFLYGIRFKSIAEDDLMYLLTYEGLDLSPNFVLGHGIQAKLALGYKF